MAPQSRQVSRRNSPLVKNAELWRRLVDEEKRHTVEWRWVKGHAGDHYNEIADELATSAARDVAAGGRVAG